MPLTLEEKQEILNKAGIKFIVSKEKLSVNADKYEEKANTGPSDFQFIASALTGKLKVDGVPLTAEESKLIFANGKVSLNGASDKVFLAIAEASKDETKKKFIETLFNSPEQFALKAKASYMEFSKEQATALQKKFDEYNDGKDPFELTTKKREKLGDNVIFPEIDSAKLGKDAVDQIAAMLNAQISSQEPIFFRDEKSGRLATMPNNYKSSTEYHYVNVDLFKMLSDPKKAAEQAKGYFKESNLVLTDGKKQKEDKEKTRPKEPSDTEKQITVLLGHYAKNPMDKPKNWELLAASGIPYTFGQESSTDNIFPRELQSILDASFSDKRSKEYEDSKATLDKLVRRLNNKGETETTFVDIQKFLVSLRENNPKQEKAFDDAVENALVTGERISKIMAVRNAKESEVDNKDAAKADSLIEKALRGFGSDPLKPLKDQMLSDTKITRERAKERTLIDYDEEGISARQALTKILGHVIDESVDKKDAKAKEVAKAKVKVMVEKGPDLKLSEVKGFILELRKNTGNKKGVDSALRRALTLSEEFGVLNDEERRKNGKEKAAPLQPLLRNYAVNPDDAAEERVLAVVDVVNPENPIAKTTTSRERLSALMDKIIAAADLGEDATTKLEAERKKLIGDGSNVKLADVEKFITEVREKAGDKKEAVDKVIADGKKEAETLGKSTKMQQKRKEYEDNKKASFSGSELASLDLPPDVLALVNNMTENWPKVGEKSNQAQEQSANNPLINNPRGGGGRFA